MHLDITPKDHSVTSGVSRRNLRALNHHDRGARTHRLCVIVHAWQCSAQLRLSASSVTQRWKSNPMFWCEYCKVWLQDNPSAKTTHERGMKHTDAVARSTAPALCY